jgi:hypothetical protein
MVERQNGLRHCRDFTHRPFFESFCVRKGWWAKVKNCCLGGGVLKNFEGKGMLPPEALHIPDRQGLEINGGGFLLRLFFIFCVGHIVR